ncbi:hypothetical protein V1477_007301 [Vespula maculifrons]|uniref:NADH dehydrogenase subunit 1 n=1 Tax=Vespula maculifrons TaxID=7453 RepID=A0ABD2CI42_VESMC
MYFLRGLIKLIKVLYLSVPGFLLLMW